MSLPTATVITATVSRKRQVTLPSTLCRALNLRPGDRLCVMRTAAGLVLRPLRESIVAQTAGSLGPSVAADKRRQS